MKVRDVWRQQDLGIFENSYTAEVPFHGVVLLKISK
jgi:alpha-galactosidase